MPRRLARGVLLSMVIATALPAGAADSSREPEFWVTGLNFWEKSLLALGYQSASLAQAAVAREGCAMVAREYPLAALIGHDGSGTATLDDREIVGSVLAVTDFDTTFTTRTVGHGEVVDTVISDLDGVFVFLERSHRIFANAQFDVSGAAGGPERYRAELVGAFRQRRPNHVSERGADVITFTAEDVPPVRWEQDTDYRRPEGTHLGRLTIVRTLRGTEPSTPGCEIHLRASVDNIAGRMQLAGTLEVRLAP